jgi:hypothetical protein
MHAQPIKKGPRPSAPRDGDKLQARRRVRNLIRAGRLPWPRDVPCADCGGLSSQYDHYLGYGAAHHTDVQAVCADCHTRRGVERGERSRPRTRLTSACVNCGREKPPYRHGRCEACRWYWNTHGVERPIPTTT